LGTRKKVSGGNLSHKGAGKGLRGKKKKDTNMKMGQRYTNKKAKPKLRGTWGLKKR